MSLRGLLIGIAGALVLLSLVTATALVVITTRMGQNTLRLHHSVESIRAAEELEIALLIHNRERRLLALTQEPSHARQIREAEELLHQWLRAAETFVSSPSEAAVLQEVSKDITEYLTAVAQQPSELPESLKGRAELDRALRTAEHLVEVNLEDARRTTNEAHQWDRLADMVALLTAGALLLGVGLGLWLLRRYAYQPLLSLRNALVHFRPGHSRVVVPEVGPRELREIAREFNEMATRLDRHREVQLGFIAGVAHDLRNPLSALRLGVSMVRPDRPLPPEAKVRERFATISRQAERLERMVEDLLDTSRVEAGKLELRLEEHDLGALVQEAVALNQGLSSEHELTLQLPREPLRLLIDGTRIAQVLNNLLSNAIKYSPQGGQIRIEVTATPDAAQVTVRDSGVGIPASERESIFEPFRRSSHTRDTVPGVGLGLSVSRRIIEAHGGHITVESEPGQGSTFSIHLPRRPAARG